MITKKAKHTGLEVSLVKGNKCIYCHKEININDFKDNISIKEYNISGLCMTCQDECFKN